MRPEETTRGHRNGHPRRFRLVDAQFTGFLWRRSKLPSTSGTTDCMRSFRIRSMEWTTIGTPRATRYLGPAPTPVNFGAFRVHHRSRAPLMRVSVPETP